MSKPLDIASEVLLACLPPGCPPSFRAIVSASFRGTGKRRTITAELIMFDGQTATVALTPWEFGWSHRYSELPGGDISFEDSRWQRVSDLEPSA